LGVNVTGINSVGGLWSESNSAFAYDIWVMMLAGFGLIGAAMRRHGSVEAAVTYG
jgi:hypothetical protein